MRALSGMIASQFRRTAAKNLNQIGFEIDSFGVAQELQIAANASRRSGFARIGDGRGTVAGIADDLPPPPDSTVLSALSTVAFTWEHDSISVSERRYRPRSRRFQTRASVYPPAAEVRRRLLPRGLRDDHRHGRGAERNLRIFGGSITGGSTWAPTQGLGRAAAGGNAGPGVAERA